MERVRGMASGASTRALGTFADLVPRPLLFCGDAKRITSESSLKISSLMCEMGPSWNLCINYSAEVRRGQAGQNLVLCPVPDGQNVRASHVAPGPHSVPV